MGELSGRVALVTGGSRGIGRAIAVALAATGAAIAVNYRERGEDAAAVVNILRSTGHRAEAFRADVSLAGPARDLIAAVEDRLGPIGILINNAGVAAAHGSEVSEE